MEGGGGCAVVKRKTVSPEQGVMLIICNKNQQFINFLKLRQFEKMVNM